MNSRRKIAIVIGLPVLVIGGVLWLFFFTGSTAETSTTKQEIADGKCSSSTQKNLESVARTAKTDQSKAVAEEKLGLCFSYNNQTDQALEHLNRAKTAFDKTDLTDDSQRVQNSIEALQAQIQEKNNSSSNSVEGGGIVSE